ncbi:MAG: hypothetical protein IPP14_08760 [Planctomycetes bacterium]|nr:hypothetical protein [Planctomycetota bacterium]
MKTPVLIALALMLAGPLCAKEELVTLPKRDSVQLTIYNSEDLTLVRERRTLSFKQGDNRLQFSWAQTLIDPTSVELQPVGDAAKAAIDIADTSYPAESSEMLIWTVGCKTAGSYTVEISYFTSGISWNAEYTGIVNADESMADLTAYVTINNWSGEEYENAQIRLVVGVIHLVEKIVYLATPRYPSPPPAPAPAAPSKEEEEDLRAMDDANEDPSDNGMIRPKEIQKAGLSEYFIFTVGGTETVQNQWSKRLRSFAVPAVPLKTVYMLKEKEFGYGFNKVLQFKNDEEHKLGKEPLPDGVLRLYKDQGNGRLGFMGELASKYIPKNEEVKVNVGPDAECTLAEKRLSLKKKDLTFQQGWLIGWTTVEEFELEVKNFRGRAVEVEIHRVVGGDFDFESSDTFETEDARTRKVTFSLAAGTARKIKFRVTTRQGSNIK